MSQGALYRKIRPKTFCEVVGQPHIVRTLQNQLKSGQVGQAYLLCGTRGTGKTSVARILSRAANCHEPSDGNPCNACESCLSALAERCMDVIEIDAASNNGVDNIRELREEVKFLPTREKYKVYIIDEVHMLSTNAFNALLKTLEEPPPHAIFILATTDQQKVPVTILSRCQRFEFRRIGPRDMGAMLRDYLDGAKIPYEEEGVDLITCHADGAMRDALSLLDQCIGGGGLSLEAVRDTLGAVSRDRLFGFADALAKKDAAKVLEITARVQDDGRDFLQFAGDLVRHFRDVLVAGISGGREFAAAYGEALAAQAAEIPAGVLMGYINGYSETMREMRLAPHMRTAFEVQSLRLCVGGARIDAADATTAEGARLGRGQKTPSRAQPEPRPEKQPESKLKSEPEPKPEPESEAPPHSRPALGARDMKSHFDGFASTLPMPLRQYLANCAREVGEGSVAFSSENGINISMLKSKKDELADAIKKHFNLGVPPLLVFGMEKVCNAQQAAAQGESGGNPDEWQGFARVYDARNVFD